MVKLVVYGNEKATCTQRVLILLEELSLEYRLHPIDLSKQHQKDPKFLAMNPFGKVPVVRYGDRTLFESRAILRYIARNNSDELDLLGDVNTDIWLEVESQNFSPVISKIVSEKVFKPMMGGKTDDFVVTSELDKFKPILTIYNDRLAEQSYIGGDEYSIADIAHIPYLHYFVNCGKEFKHYLKEYPHVYKWYKKLLHRKYVKRVLFPEVEEEVEEEKE